jgi:hypothetical protein
MTKQEAKEKYCPMKKSNCVADDCAMWREERVDSEGRPLGTPLGWCGLAGRAGAL